MRCNPKVIVALATLCCACVTNKGLGELDTATDGVDGSGESGETPNPDTDTVGETDPTDDSESATGENPPMEGVGPAAVDILFVVDNSGSMGEEQGQLSESLPSLVETLETTGLDYRIAVTTTDDGNYWCRGAGISAPEAGDFVFSSCRERQNDFQFSGTGEDARFACTDYCPEAWSTILQTATPTAEDPTPSRRPWIESTDGVTNLPDGLDVATALQCLAPQGINGCGFESPLESVYKALRRTEQPQENAYGFVRTDAHLMVIYLSDEADCSANTDWESIFYSDGEGGNQVFWTLPGEQQSPTSGVCWNAGVQCSGDPSSYDDCVPQDYDIDGNPTNSFNDAVLFPLSRYSDYFDELRSAKAESHAQLFLFGIVGVPEDYASTREINYAEGPGAGDLDSFQARYGIAPGCTGPNAEAVPPVRVRALFEDAALTDGSALHSICSANYTSALTQMVAQVNSFVGI